MIFSSPHREVVSYLEQIDQMLINSGQPKISKTQKRWLSFCITAMIITNSVSWAKFCRASGGSYKERALAWIFRHSAIPWNKIFTQSILLLLRLYGIKEGVLVTDDTDRKRSKSTSKIYGVHKIKDKKTNGFTQGQEIVFLLLVARNITFPVGFELYIPDPEKQLWRDNDEYLKSINVRKEDRPVKPKRSKKFPSKLKIAMNLIRQFRVRVSSKIEIKSILADAAFMSPILLSDCKKIYPKAQVISQLKRNQIVIAGRKPAVSVEKYFASAQSRVVEISLRGNPPIKVEMASARLQVRSLGRKMLVVAIKYEGETEFRYIAASDLTWRSIDVVQQYSWRWLIEVFNQDWKWYEGWGRMALQQREDGTRRGVILSLLLDHALLSHSAQLRLARAAQPLWTVGSLSRQMQLDSLLDAVRCAFEAIDPVQAFKQLADQLQSVVVLRQSDKHLSGKTIAPFEGRCGFAKQYANSA